MKKKFNLSSYHEMQLMIKKIYEKKQLVIKDTILNNDDKIIIISKIDKILNDIASLFADINLVSNSIDEEINAISEEFNKINVDILDIKLNKIENLLPNDNQLKFLEKLLFGNKKKTKTK